jgi:hypothetical protein
MRQPTVRREDWVEVGRGGKAAEEEWEVWPVWPVVEWSSEWESKKVVMGAWKRRRLVIESMVLAGGCAQLKGVVEARGDWYGRGRRYSGQLSLSERHGRAN